MSSKCEYPVLYVSCRQAVSSGLTCCLSADVLLYSPGLQRHFSESSSVLVLLPSRIAECTLWLLCMLWELCEQRVCPPCPAVFIWPLCWFALIGRFFVFWIVTIIEKIKRNICTYLQVSHLTFILKQYLLSAIRHRTEFPQRRAAEPGSRGASPSRSAAPRRCTELGKLVPLTQRSSMLVPSAPPPRPHRWTSSFNWAFVWKWCLFTFPPRQAKYCQLMDTLLEASTQYLHNCCLIIFMTRGAGSFCRIEDDILWQ